MKEETIYSFKNVKKNKEEKFFKNLDETNEKTQKKHFKSMEGRETINN